MRETRSEIRNLYGTNNRLPSFPLDSHNAIEKTNDAIKSYNRNWVLALGAQGVVRAYKFDLETGVN